MDGSPLLDNRSHHAEAEWVILEEAPSPLGSGDPASGKPRPVVRFEDLEVGYGRNTVLHDITTQVEAGECVAITGNNGSGKSTLVNALVGIIPFQRGEIDLLGYVREAGQKPRGERPWNKLGYVPQRLRATGGIDASVAEVVQAGLLGVGSLRPPRNWREQVRHALDRVGLRHRENDKFAVLSGGQQQRGLIARALIRNPELVIFDEPLAGLDAHNRERLAELIGEHQKAGGTSLIVLHELGELRPLITREIRIASGHIVHDGPCTHVSHVDFDGPWVSERWHDMIGDDPR